MGFSATAKRIKEKLKKNVEKVNVPITSPFLGLDIIFWFHFNGRMLNLEIQTCSHKKSVLD